MATEGQLIQNRYLLRSRLGSGGQGSVWRATDELLGRDVALKELLPNVNGIDLYESRLRALREARALAALRHPAIVHIYDVIKVRDDPWIVMDYIRGRSLDTIIRDDPPLDERAVAAIGVPVVRGLRAVHDAGIVHRDVKPANIVKANDGPIFLVDFGIATIDGDTSITGQSRVLGTTEFMAPERLRDSPAGPPADLWSLGITLFCALERYSPFLRQGEGRLQATISAILYDPLPPLTRGGRLAGIVRQMLRKDASKRPDAAAVEAVLVAVADGMPGAAGQYATTKSSAAGQWAVAPHRYRGHNETSGTHRIAGPRADSPASRLRIADAVEILSNSSTDSGVALLLDMADSQAADVLARCTCSVAGHLLQGVAAAQPETAGSIFQIFPAPLAGKVLCHMSPAIIATILTSMSAAGAARILNEADIRTAARGMAELPSSNAGQFLKAMDERRAAEVLGHVTPSGVAAMLKTLPRDLSARLLARLTPAFRELVRRNL